MATTKEIPENKKVTKTEAKTAKVPKAPKAKKVGKTFRSLPDDVKDDRMNKLWANAKELCPEGESFARSLLMATNHRKYENDKKSQ